MVRCGRCGAENSDEARYCVECGAPLQPRVRYERDWRDRRDACLGPFMPLNLILLFGVIIVLAGLLELLKVLVGPIWPSIYRLHVAALAAILIGGYIIYTVYSRSKSR